MKTGMKNYLDLVLVSSRIHRKQSKMSIFCIILSIVALSLVLAVHGPVRKIRNMSIVDTISAE